MDKARILEPKEHIDSYYAANALPLEKFRRLDGIEKTQTCVIGGGLAGLTCALELVLAGEDVILLEANRVGWGASGRNGGFVSSGYARANSSILNAVGMEDAREMYQLSQMGRDYVSNTIGKAKRPEIILGEGWLNIQRHDNYDQLQQNHEILSSNFGADCELLSADELSLHVRSAKYFGGILDKGAFHIQPLQYTNLLARLASQNGVRIFEQSRCIKLSKADGAGGARWHATTESGSVQAQNIVLATSAYGGPHPPLNRAFIPVATYVVASSSANDLFDEFIPFEGCITDTRRAGDYYRTVKEFGERRLVWGGRITTQGSHPEKLKQMLKSDIIDVFPAFENIDLEYSWSGLMGYAPSQMPIIGKMDEGLWAATAFGGHGLNTTAMAGQLISRAITENDDRFLLFEKFGPKWAGGKLGQWATQLSYWKLQLQDWWDEKANNPVG